MNFKEWLLYQEMWFTDSKVTTKRKMNKNLEGTALPRSQAPRPPAQQPGSKPPAQQPGSKYPFAKMKKQ